MRIEKIVRYSYGNRSHVKNRTEIVSVKKSYENRTRDKIVRKSYA